SRDCPWPLAGARPRPLGAQRVHGRRVAGAEGAAGHPSRPSAFLPPPRARRPRCPSEPVAGARSRTVPAARDQSGHDGSAGLVTSIGYSFLHRVVYTAGV
ncbi:unnamed protein product, partial [Prorocentrum cordatum]